MKLRNRTTHFGTMPEGKPPRRRSPGIASRVYFLLLIFLVSYIAWYAGSGFMVIEQRGVVVLEKHVVRADENGRIFDIPVSDATPVTTGEVLYRYHPEAPVESLADREILRIRKDLELSCAERNLLSKTIDNMMRMDIHSSQEFDESVLDVDLEISRTLSKRNLLQKRLAWMVQNHEKAGDMIFTKRALELVRKTDKEMVGYRENSDPAVFDLQEQIKTLEQTLEDLKRHRESLILSQIREMNRKRESLDHEILAAETHLKELSRWSRSEESAQGPERVLSPVSGEVYKTYKQRGDPFKRNDIILTVIEPDATVSIEGYFPEKELKYVTAGKEVTVIFPDGRKCRGVIDTIFAAASSQPELLKENYIPIESGLVVAIRPLLAREAHLWRRYDRMDARIRLNKWNMNI